MSDKISSKTIIERGLYFSHGIEWYCSKFVMPVGSSLMYLIFFIINALSICVITLLILSMFPLKEKVVMIVTKNRPAGTFLRLSNIREAAKPIEDLAIFCIKNYVRQREEQILPSDSSVEEIIIKKKNFVFLSSSPQVINDFNRKLSDYNESIGDFAFSGTETKIKIGSVILRKKTSLMQNLFSLSKRGDDPHRATIYFTSIRKGKNLKNFRVDIDFRIFVPRNRKDKRKMSFIVTSYDSFIA